MKEATVRDQLLARLQELKDLGEDGLPRLAPVADAAPDSADAPAPASPARGSARAPTSAHVADEAHVAPIACGTLDLAGLKSALFGCLRCRLSAGRTQVVYGVGPDRARLMFVGEAPGRDEDLRGEPFVGKAGQLLTDMIEKGMGLQRSDVYIANVVKCRPPENRNPEPDEVESCSPYLRRQLELVQPEVIVALGAFAAQALLKTTERISRLRGTWHAYEGIPVMPTFHPAYLLRSPAEKRTAWSDLQQVMEKLGLA